MYYNLVFSQPLLLQAFLYIKHSFYFAYVAFRIGPFGLTRLISSFSLMFAIFYGIFFLNEPTTAITYIGIALVVCAMVLMNYKGKGATAKKEENGVSLKWFLCLMISVFANGFIAILTKMQQIKFDGACDNEFQMISVGGSFLILAIIGIISERKNLRAVIKTGAIWGGLAGLLNGAKNAAVIAVYLFLPLSTVSPLKTGLALIGAFLVSLVFYKEKYTLSQKIGVILGVAAVVLLAL